MKKNGSFKSVDALSKELDAVDNFVLKHWKKYVLIASIVFVAIAVFLVSSITYTNSSITTSNETLAATTVQQLKDVIKKYPNKPLTQYKQLDLASKLIEAKNYTEAADIYNKIISFDDKSYAAPVARLNLAYLLESQGKTDEAIESFSKISDNGFLPPAIRSEAEYSAGRICLTLGKKDLAFGYFKRCSVADQASCTGWPGMAQDLLNRMN